MEEALASEWADQWSAVTIAELNALSEKGTYELVDLLQECRAIGVKWVFKVKYNVDGTIQKFKARLVAKGFSQCCGIDYNKTFASVVYMNSMRIFFAVAAWEGLIVEQMNVDNAYLNGWMDKKVYSVLPEIRRSTHLIRRRGRLEIINKVCTKVKAEREAEKKSQK